MDKENDNNTPSRKERRKLKRQRENGSQTDEDKSEADGMIQNGGATVWQEEVNKKLDSLLKLIPLVQELKEDLKKLEEENESIRKSLTWAMNEITDLKKFQTNTNEELCEAKELLLKVNQELDLLQRRNIKLEAQSRRNNIKFYNVKETENNDGFKETEIVLKRLRGKKRWLIWNLREFIAYLHVDQRKATLESQDQLLQRQEPHISVCQKH